MSGNTVCSQALYFQKLAKMDHFWHFYINVARFARNVECDFFCDFQTLCLHDYNFSLQLLRSLDARAKPTCPSPMDPAIWPLGDIWSETMFAMTSPTMKSVSMMVEIAADR